MNKNVGNTADTKIISFILDSEWQDIQPVFTLLYNNVLLFFFIRNVITFWDSKNSSILFNSIICDRRGNLVGN